MPPAELTAQLAAPPLYTAKNCQDLAKDDQLRMKLLGIAVIDANTRGRFISKIYDAGK